MSCGQIVGVTSYCLVPRHYASSRTMTVRKAKKNSSNSSKPPSSDIVNPTKAANKKRKRKRKPGGQKGHPKHERPDFPPESINETWEYTLASCPLRGGGLEDADHAPRVVHQAEIIDVPIRIEAEQAIRFVVIDRRITQGTRSKAGRDGCERIWTTIATCTQRGLDVFEFLRQSLLSHWTGSAYLSIPDNRTAWPNLFSSHA